MASRWLMQILHIFEFCSKMCRICIGQRDAIERKPFTLKVNKCSKKCDKTTNFFKLFLLGKNYLKTRISNRDSSPFGQKSPCLASSRREQILGGPLWSQKYTRKHAQLLLLLPLPLPPPPPQRTVPPPGGPSTGGGKPPPWSKQGRWQKGVVNLGAGSLQSPLIQINPFPTSLAWGVQYPRANSVWLG